VSDTGDSGRPPGAPAPRGVRLTANDLTLGYADPPGARPIVEGLNLTLEPGERVALVGASGSGKTTLLHCLAGLLRPLEGEVTVDTEVVASSAGPCTSRHAAYMFQRDLLLPWKTALENAVLVASVARGRAGAAGGRGGAQHLALAGRAEAPAPAAARPGTRAHAEALLREFGLGDALHARPHQLSGGMRQRVALARTLLLGRGLVLLDEPFAGLDSLTRADLQDWMRSVMESHAATWVLVTHDVHEASLLAERVAVLGGRPAGIVGWVDTTTDPPEAPAELRRLLTLARGLSYPAGEAPLFSSR
jgi:ABC-type nitrate/sulfonate/bicarbonate transport system ATPase subunit